MASPQPTDSHTRISNELYTQILMRDFTKRQRAILDLVIRFSYGCGKKTALLTQTKIFTLCGVQHNKVRKELNELRKMSVIDWDELEGRYWINKDYDVWDIERPEEESERYFAEILRVNINDQKGHAQNGHDQKGQSDMTKKVNESCPKRSTESAKNVDVAWPDAVPITKDNYKEIKNINNNKIMNVAKILSKLFPYGISETMRYDINQYIDDGLEPEMLNIAYNIADGKDPGQKASYMKGILRGFMNSQIKTVSQYELQLAERESATSKQGGKSDVRKPASRYSNETEAEWEEFERNFYKQ